MRTPTAVLTVLSLGVAFAGLSCGAFGAWSTSADLGGPTFTLTADLPDRTRTLVVTVLPADNPTGQSLSGTVFLEATSLWTPPSDIGTIPDRPTLVVGIAPEGSAPSGSGQETTVLSEREQTTLSVFVTALEGCTDADPCVERYTVTTSADPVEGTVDVDWALSADVLGSEGDAAPAGLDVTLELE